MELSTTASNDWCPFMPRKIVNFTKFQSYSCVTLWTFSISPFEASAILLSKDSRCHRREFTLSRSFGSLTHLNDSMINWFYLFFVLSALCLRSNFNRLWKWLQIFRDRSRRSPTTCRPRLRLSFLPESFWCHRASVRNARA